MQSSTRSSRRRKVSKLRKVHDLFCRFCLLGENLDCFRRFGFSFGLTNRFSVKIRLSHEHWFLAPPARRNSRAASPRHNPTNFGELACRFHHVAVCAQSLKIFSVVIECHAPRDLVINLKARGKKAGAARTLPLLRKRDCFARLSCDFASRDLHSLNFICSSEKT